MELPDTLGRIFLRGFASCEWHNVLSVNFPADPRVLRPLLPAGTELDFFEGRAWVSLVGMTLKNSASLGVPIPTQRDSQQVNARFYVKRRLADGTFRRGVVFLEEWTPKPVLAFTARLLLNEKAHTARVERRLAPAVHGIAARYSWKSEGEWQHLHARTKHWQPHHFEPGSGEAFFLHRPWSYSRQRDGSTVEIRMKHPQWRVYPLGSFEARLGDEWVRNHEGLFSVPAKSAFFAEGSSVRVCGFSRLPAHAAAPTRPRALSLLEVQGTC